MAVKINKNFLCICLLCSTVRADSGEFFVSSSRAGKHPCEYDESKCQYGICRQTEKLNDRNFLCACPPKRTGTLCEKTTGDCLNCKPEARTECTGFSDGRAVCICLEYIHGKTDAPSICYFQYKAKSDRQKACDRGDHSCTRGQQCMNYAQVDYKMVTVCQCPVGNTRGSNCEEDYKFDIPGDVYPCIDTNLYGAMCMCKKYGDSGDRYGFCKPKLVKPDLIAPLSDEGPCSFSNNKCRHGTCYLTDTDKFVCGCPSRYSGKYCHYRTTHCAECKKDQRVECIGLEDGSGVCICMGYSKPDKFAAPSLCHFPKAKAHRQKSCKSGDHPCDPGQQCVNYAHDEAKMQVTCQCPIGRTRGKDCLEDYEFIDLDDQSTDCLYSETYGPVCLCYKYGTNRNRPGFCKPIVKTHDAVVKPKGSGGPCDISGNKCRQGVCMETQATEDWNFLCACPHLSTGELCHQEMNECSRCQKGARKDCIGLPDGTAVCICLQLLSVKFGIVPLICHFKKAKPHRQKVCISGHHNCDPGQECVNYAQSEDRMQVTCQCPAGKKRGNNCQEDYKVDNPAGRFSCVDTMLYGPICMCDKYNYGDSTYGFCLPQLKESTSFKLVTNAGNTLFKTDSPCDISHNICKEGVCMEIAGDSNAPFICSCPYMKTGKLCAQDMHDCVKCRKIGRKDCVALPDGTAVCICVEFMQQNTIDEPSICFFKKAKTHRQKSCNRGEHNCDPGQQCVNYAQVEYMMQVECVCPAGHTHGKNCKQEYKVSPTTDFPCADTQGFGPICLCEEYGHGIDKFGFCKPNLKDQAIAQDVSKRSQAKETNTEEEAPRQELFPATGPAIKQETSTENYVPEENISSSNGDGWRNDDIEGDDDEDENDVEAEVSNRGPDIDIDEQRLEDDVENYERYAPLITVPMQVSETTTEGNINKADSLPSIDNGKEHYDKKEDDSMVDNVAETRNDGTIHERATNDGSSINQGYCLPGICNTGICKYFGYSGGHLCACPLGKTGPRCEKKSYPCWACKKGYRDDCIGLPDGTARCICTTFIDGISEVPPAICYFPRAKPHRQKSCNRGEHNCDSNQQCVNYAHDESKMQMTCQCPAGSLHGDNCNQTYSYSLTSSHPSCANINGQEPICLCKKNRLPPEFCKPKLSRKGSEMCTTDTCGLGQCIESKGAATLACACPKEKTGARCEKGAFPCSACEKTARHDCIGLPDGTGRCICTKFIQNWGKEVPAICYFKRALPHRQKSCNRGEHQCTERQQCVNYALDENKMQMTCQCPLGGYRGINCQEEYRFVSSNEMPSCLYVERQMPICLCQKFGTEAGFCQLKMEDNEQRLEDDVDNDERSAPRSTVPMQETTTEGNINKADSLPSIDNGETDYDQKEDDNKVDNGYTETEETTTEGNINKADSLPSIDNGAEDYDQKEDDNKVDNGYTEAEETTTEGNINKADSLPRIDNGEEDYDQKEDDNKVDNSYTEAEGHCLPGICNTGICKHFGYSGGHLCACPLGKTGPMCEKKSYPCWACKKGDREDCIGLPDGTARCICTAFIDGISEVPPAICYFPRAKLHRQKSCNRGEHNCDSNQQCVNYAHDESKMQLTCQCPAGSLHGDNCQKTYSFNLTSRHPSCANIDGQEPICLCKRNKLPPEFCKPKLSRKGSEMCTMGTCGLGQCIESKGDATLACACPKEKTGARCEKGAFPCSLCEKTARHDCIGLPDGTGRCICIKFIQNWDKEVPAICYFKRALPHRQKSCNRGEHQCTERQQCVNYALDENKMQMTCQCPLGAYRGINCQQEYGFVSSNEMPSCLHVEGQMPICLCQKYGTEAGFCKLKMEDNEPILGEDQDRINDGNISSGTTPMHEKSTPNGIENDNEDYNEEDDDYDQDEGGDNEGTTTTVSINNETPRDYKLSDDQLEEPILNDDVLNQEMYTTTSWIPSAVTTTGDESLKRKRSAGYGSFIYQDYCLPGVCNSGICKPLGDSSGHVCACPFDKTGSMCEEKSYPCWACKKGAREDCIGLPDGTARCICTTFIDGIAEVPPAICYFPKAKPSRQKSCNRGEHSCSSAQQCVNYAQDENKMQMTCQCPVGTSHGDNCQERYNTDLSNGPHSCSQVDGDEPVCLCLRNGLSPDFCKPELARKGSLDMCSLDTCGLGYCIELRGDASLACACPKEKTGSRCKKGAYPCSACEKTARHDCIGLPDGTGRCICTKFIQNSGKEVPAICYFKRALPHRQKSCSRGEHQCTERQQCVNYALDENKMQMTCQCPAGAYRGSNCQEEYMYISTNEMPSCMYVEGQIPICLCQKYGNEPGFCKLLMKQNGNKETEISNSSYTGSGTAGFMDDDGSNVMEKDVPDISTKFAYETPECTKCKKESRTECVGLSDGTAFCICTEFMEKQLGTSPAICHFRKAKSHRQKSCNAGDHDCDLGQECVNYAQSENMMQMTCQCPEGETRGKHCEEDYQTITPDDETSCVKTVFNGIICLCYEYGTYGDGPGFCKQRFNTHVTNDDRLSTLDPCDAKNTKCRHGVCKKTEAEDGLNFVCVCPPYYSGRFCHYDSLDCLRCKKRTDCIKTEDGTAVCICLETWKKAIETPLICHFKSKPKSHRQKVCNDGIDDCTGDQECVNYAQIEMQMAKVCQCPLGKLRGQGCEEEYQLTSHGQEMSCVLLGDGSPRCLCNEYADGEEYGFCKLGDRSSISNKDHRENSTPKSEIDQGVAPETPYNDEASGNTIEREPELASDTNSTPEDIDNQALHLLDPGFKEEPCSSKPCLHGGICKPHMGAPTDDYICVCPLGRNGKNCEANTPDCDDGACKKKTDCISTPEGAICACIIDFQEQLCSIKMRNVTEWEKLKLVITPRTIEEIEIVAIVLLVLTTLTMFYLIWHCIKVASKRQEYNVKYENVIKKGEVPTNPLPDWLDVSNDLARQTFCCSLSKLPRSFNPKKKSKGKKRNKIKYKNKKGDKKRRDGKHRNQNENFPASNMIYGLNSYRCKTSGWLNTLYPLKRGGTLNRNHINETSKYNRTRDNKNKLRQEYVTEYIKKHQKYFVRRNSSLLNSSYLQNISSEKSRDQWAVRGVLKDMNVRFPKAEENHCYPRSRSAQRLVR